jgi:hypothetical protein
MSGEFSALDPPVLQSLACRSPKPELGRKGDGMVGFNVDSWRQIRTDMTGSDIEAPSGIGLARDSHGVDQIGGQSCGRTTLDSLRFLLNLESGSNNHKFFDGDREGNCSERPSLPIECIPTIAILLCVRPADPG